MIVFGTRLFGEVDQVPGLFSVRTRFFHINFLPLVPTASFLMFGPDRGVELTTVQLRSVLVCWARAALLLGGGLTLLFGGITMGDPADRQRAIALLVVGALLVIGLVASFRLSRATKDRALALCDLAGLPEEMKNRVERHFRQAAQGGREEF